MSADLNAWEDGRVVRGLRVNPSVYDVIAAARPYEVARGDPLLLLDLELIPDSGTATHDPVVVTN